MKTVTQQAELICEYFIALADPNSILVRHRRFLKQLERQKNIERQEQLDIMAEKENKTKAFKDAAARQREKIKGLKHTDEEEQDLEAMAVGGPGEENI